MAKRFTDTELWDKEWYMKLTLKQKCLLKLIRDKCDLCGVWSPNWIIASAYIGEAVKEVDLLEIDNGQQFKKLPSGKIYCIGFIEFQYGNLSEKSPVHKKILSLLEQNGLLDNYKQTPYKYPINRVQDKEEDKEEVKEEYKVKDGNEKFLIPEILQNWYETFPTYTKSKDDDFPAVLRIISFMMQQHGIPNMNDPDAKEKILGTFEAIAELVKKESFWINKPLKSIANNVQEFYNKIKNPIKNGSRKTGSNLRAEVQDEFNRRYGG